ncbi:unnamed protein product [marine sediment metagenome]|uniref:Uncharacterized protein n=1 Tax=marine sediment metagenome TaxID=412755 RepID=X1LX55_9ZZZZ
MGIMGQVPVFKYFEPTDIRLDGGETQLLEAGFYSVLSMFDDYSTVGAFNSGKLHIEIFKAAAWHDWITSSAGDLLSDFWADGDTLRVANADVPGTFFRLIGMRRY